MPTYMINCGDYQDLALIEIGNHKCAPLYSFGPFIRNEYIFHYVISGKGYVSINPGSDATARLSSLSKPQHGHPVKAGEGFLLEPHTKHLYYADEQDPWHYIWIVFKGLSVPNYLRKCGLSRTDFIYHPKDYQVHTSQMIRSHLLTILDNPTAEPSFIIGHLSLFFSDLIRFSDRDDLLYQTIPKSMALSNHYMTQAISFISRNHCNIRSLDEIADYCHISRSHLGRLFRDNLHVSLQEYLIQYRLNRAKDLLSTTSMSVSEIAMDVGYQNELNLLRAFKKAYGISPSAWRSQNTV